MKASPQKAVRPIKSKLRLVEECFAEENKQFSLSS